MKKFATGLLAVATVAVLMPSVARATDMTIKGEVPEACIYTVELPDLGPARKVHYTTPDYPDCEDVEGICVTVTLPGGPSRAVHRPHGDEDPCVPIDESCDIIGGNVTGPARAVHQAQRHPRNGSQDLVIEIPAECQQALSEALVPAGSDSGTIVWLAALFVGVGGAMVVTRRAIVIRTR